MWSRASVLCTMLAVLGGCAAMPSLGAPSVGPPPLPECRAESYAFAGRGTFADLGLVGQSAAVLPEPHRPATIWVTRDPVRFGATAPDGGSRMLCFEFDDGSGGSEWPVNDAWQPPLGGVTAPAEVNLTIPLLLLAAVIIVGVIAFRRA